MNWTLVSTLAIPGLMMGLLSLRGRTRGIEPYLIRPGALTCAFLEGHRIRSVEPLNLAMAYTVLGLVYLIVAHRRVFQRGWATTALQAVGLLAWFYVLLAAWLGSVMALAAWMTIP